MERAARIGYPCVSRLWRYSKRLLLVVLIALVALLSPVAYVETMCRGTGAPDPYTALISSDHHRAETRTLMTYPEWHIVHAYDDYARVIATDDPHDFGYLRAIGGFWSSLCSLSVASSAHGQVDSATKQMVYVIGVSFTAELLLKAAYEETLGRLFATLRGNERAPLDDLSAQQAADYARFLQQVPWYKWDFAADAAALDQRNSGSVRDRERALALGLEYSAKAAYAEVIAAAVAQTGADELRLRMVVTGADAGYFAKTDGVTVIAERDEGIEVETPRYRELTHLMQQFALDGVSFVEIAGNDDILFTAISPQPTAPDAIFSRARQGADDYRHLIVLKVAELADRLRAMQDGPLRLEHIHDY